MRSLSPTTLCSTTTSTATRCTGRFRCREKCQSTRWKRNKNESLFLTKSNCFQELLLQYSRGTVRYFIILNLTLRTSLFFLSSHTGEHWARRVLEPGHEPRRGRLAQRHQPLWEWPNHEVQEEDWEGRRVRAVRAGTVSGMPVWHNSLYCVNVLHTAKIVRLSGDAEFSNTCHWIIHEAFRALSCKKGYKKRRRLET